MNHWTTVIAPRAARAATGVTSAVYASARTIARRLTGEPWPGRTRCAPRSARRARANSGAACGGTGPRDMDRSAGDVALDELLDGVPGHRVRVLHRRRLHEVARRRQQRAADPAVHRDLAGPQRVDDDARRVGRVPHLQLEIDIQRYVAERLALQPDVRPLAVHQ